MSKTISLFIPNLNIGGEERVIATLASQFANHGYKTDLILISAKGKFLSEVSDKVNVVNLKAKNAYSSVPNLIRYWRSSKPEILISTLDLTNLIALIVRKVLKLNTRVIIRIASTVSIQKRSLLKKKIEKLLLSIIYTWADEIIAVSLGVSEDLSRYTKIPLERIKVLYNPVITPSLLEKREENIDHPWFGEGQQPIVLGIGRLHDAKNFALLIESFSMVNSIIPAKLIILGEGDKRPELESLIKKFNLSDYVALPGSVSNPYKYLKNAAVYVLSSNWEGLPTTLIEALACGCPVVSTDCSSGPNDILKGGKYGYLSPVADPNLLAQGIIKVLGGKIKNVDEEWLEQFTLETIFNKWLEIVAFQQG